MIIIAMCLFIPVIISIILGGADLGKDSIGNDIGEFLDKENKKE